MYLVAVSNHTSKQVISITCDLLCTDIPDIPASCFEIKSHSKAIQQLFKWEGILFKHSSQLSIQSLLEPLSCLISPIQNFSAAIQSFRVSILNGLSTCFFIPYFAMCSTMQTDTQCLVQFVHCMHQL